MASTSSFSTPPSNSMYARFWKAMDRLTEVKPITEQQSKARDAERRYAAFHKVSQNISTIKEFLDDIEKVGDAIRDAGGSSSQLFGLIMRVRKHVAIVEVSTGAADDAIQAAVETQAELSAWYRNAYSACKSDGDDDREFICMAAIDRLYQGRNVKFVLGKQDGSFVRKVYEKWSHRLKELIVPF